MFALQALRSDQFSWQAALSLAGAANASYELDASKLRATVIGQWKFKEMAPMGAGVAQGFLAATDDVLLLAFRGSDTFTDWFNNLDVLPAADMFDGISVIVSQGFLAVFGGLRRAVAAAISSPSSANRKIWLTGHSLGGALAAIAATEFAHTGRITGLHTFGQPQLGDAAMAGYFNARLAGRSKRFVNNRDPVTRLPLGYQHVGTLVRFNTAGDLDPTGLERMDAALELPPLSQAEFERFQRQVKAGSPILEAHANFNELQVPDQPGDKTFGFDLGDVYPDLKDHYMANYVACLERQQIA